MKPLSLLTLGAALALSGSNSSLQAQDLRYGLQIHGNIPMGDLKDATDSKVGIGGGAHMTIDLGEGHMLRPRLDYVVFPENKNFNGIISNSSATGNFKAKDASLGLDYLYNFSGKEDGFYVTGGLAYHRWTADYDYSQKVGTVTTTGTSSTTSSKAGFAVGAGFNFNANFGVEARYVASKFGQGGKDSNAGALQLSALYRF